MAVVKYWMFENSCWLCIFTYPIWPDIFEKLRKVFMILTVLSLSQHRYNVTSIVDTDTAD